MLKMCLAALAALSLVACATVAAVNPDGGVVENAMSAKGALTKADAHCQASNRTAKTLKYDALMGTLTYECVPKS